LGELLDTPPPGLDEAIAISKVMQFLEAQEYSMFSRIVFDTAPTVIIIYHVVSRVDSRYPIALPSVICFPC